MKTPRCTLILLALFLLAHPAWSQDSSDDQAALIEEMLELSGIRSELEVMGVQVMDQMESITAQLSAEYQLSMTEFIPFMKQTLNVDTLYRQAVDQLRAEPADTVQMIIDWFKSPHGTTMRTLADEAMVRAQNGELESFLIKLESSPELQEKKALIERFDSVTKITEHTIGATLHRVRAFTLGGLTAALEEKHSFLDPHYVDSLNQIVADERVEEVRPMIEQQYAHIPTYLLFSFHTVPESDLEAWIAFFETDVGQWYLDATYEAVQRVFEPAFETLGGALARLTEEENPPESEYEVIQMEEILQPGEFYDEAADVYAVVNEMPEVIGGMKSLREHIVYPAQAKEAGVEGEVILHVIIDEQGVPIEVKVMVGIGAGCDEEAVRVIRATRFEPGRLEGKTVKVRMIMTVTFELPQD